ncbi:MAG: hypothetical protein K0Q58_615 [Microbacterium sp.]|nr:hypothetical protein [Microbacterium sp.]
MTPLLFLLIVIAGGAGAGLRYLIDLLITAIAGARLPWGTLVINVTGSFALGLLAGSTADAGALAVVGTGLLGGYTTFSSVAASSAVLWSERRTAASVGNALGTLAATIAAASGGLALAAAFSG